MAPKGQCPLGHRGEFPDVCPSVHSSAPPYWTLGPQISNLKPDFSPLDPQISLPRPILGPSDFTYVFPQRVWRWGRKSKGRKEDKKKF